MKILVTFIICTVLANAETSMFGAGDLESSNPYGLTKTEEVIVKNKKIVTKNEKRLKKTSTHIQDLEERVNGIESLLEGESLKLNKFSKSVTKNHEAFKLFEQNVTRDIDANNKFKLDIKSNFNSQFEKLKLQVEQNDDNIQTLKKSFDQIVTLVNDINSKYVSKKDFDKLLSLLDKQSSKQATAKKTTAVSKKSSSDSILSNKSSKELMKEGRRLFKIDYFTKAKIIFEDLVSKKYRPAESNYYLGEISYYRKDYKNALHFFKTSMTLYDKSSYLPKLLLHSAISFDKLGDTDNAQNFYNTIVDLYPGTNEAKEASKKIK